MWWRWFEHRFLHSNKHSLIIPRFLHIFRYVYNEKSLMELSQTLQSHDLQPLKSHQNQQGHIDFYQWQQQGTWVHLNSKLSLIPKHSGGIMGIFMGLAELSGLDQTLHVEASSVVKSRLGMSNFGPKWKTQPWPWGYFSSCSNPIRQPSHTNTHIHTHTVWYSHGHSQIHFTCTYAHTGRTVSRDLF